ncbi:MAG TPA: hypothetical protein VKY24_01915 [Reyranella sp.]|nr:hypothetical protein [Reyranella sp.]
MTSHRDRQFRFTANDCGRKVQIALDQTNSVSRAQAKVTATGISSSASRTSTGKARMAGAVAATLSQRFRFKLVD